ncbi:MAG TPA: hypothetical protein PLD47_18235, partial [Aggregatilineales bacterium]|nr:hypothetical protein [Aggregatilineales bacterium]
MRVVYPYVTNEGFGNNVVTLAKAWLISQSCGMRYQRPAWQFSHHVQPPTPNGYGYYFPTTRGDALRLKTYDLLFRAQAKLKRQVIPTIFFDYAHYAETGIIDVGEACRVMLQQQGLDSPRQSVVLYTAGNWGQYDGIVRARGWVRELLLSHADAARLFGSLRRIVLDELHALVTSKRGELLSLG